LRIQVNYNAGDVRAQIDTFLKRLRAIKREPNTESGKIKDLIDEYVLLVQNLGMPITSGDPIDSRETATREGLIRILQNIEFDLMSVAAAQDSITTAIQSSYNRNQALLLGLNGEVKNAAAEAVTAAIKGGLLQRGTFVVTEMFDDLERINLDATSADVVTGGGALTLRKTALVPVDMGRATLSIHADDSTPVRNTVAGDNIGRPNPDIAAIEQPELRPPYEGRFFDLLGNAEFEGGMLKLVAGPNNTLVPAEVPEVRKQSYRKLILDSTPDTYHQVERVVLGQDENIPVEQIDMYFPYVFDVTYTLDIGDMVTAGMVVLDPLNFSDRAWLEVRDIQTSADNREWTTIPGMHSNLYYNVITSEANSVLADDHNSLLGPSKYRYKGRGLWIFGARDFKYLRVLIRQRTPVVQPYEVFEVEQQRTVVKSSGGIKVAGVTVKKGKTKSSTERKTTELSYEESLQLANGESVMDIDLGSYKASEGISISLPGIPNSNLFSIGGSSTEKSAWTITNIRPVVKDNALRYAIGIRDLDVVSAEYDTTSVYESQPFIIASPIRQIMLTDDSIIPQDFPAGSYIRYSVSVDGGNTWARIAPDNIPPVYEEVRIPTVVQVNSNTPDDAKEDRFGYLDIPNSANNVIVRIELSRPLTNIGETPIVNRYILKVLTVDTPGLDI